MTDLDDIQFCTYCSESFPMDDPMVEYDGNTYCSPNCVRDSLADEDPCDHAQYVGAVARFNASLSRIMEGDRVMIHMAETRQTAAGTWMWYCRCPEMGDGFTTQKEAREAGDKHLAVANG